MNNFISEIDKISAELNRRAETIKSKLAQKSARLNKTQTEYNQVQQSTLKSLELQGLKIGDKCCFNLWKTITATTGEIIGIAKNGRVRIKYFPDRICNAPRHVVSKYVPNPKKTS
jgi:hypothetical protein